MFCYVSALLFRLLGLLFRLYLVGLRAWTCLGLLAFIRYLVDLFCYCGALWIWCFRWFGYYAELGCLVLGFGLIVLIAVPVGLAFGVGCSVVELVRFVMLLRCFALGLVLPGLVFPGVWIVCVVLMMLLVGGVCFGWLDIATVVLLICVGV